MYDEKWQRWISASINTYFKTAIEARGYDVFLEGDTRNTQSWDDFVEVRVDGPYHTQIARNDYLLKVEVNLLVQSAITPTKGLYVPEDIVGIVTALMVQSIPVYKKVDAPMERLGCLIVDDAGSRDIVRVSNFGQIETDVKIRQFTVECHYKIELEGI